MFESELDNYLIHGGDECAVQIQGMMEELEDPTVDDTHQQDEKEELPAVYSIDRVDTLPTYRGKVKGPGD